MDLIGETIAALDRARKEYGPVACVSFSGGKDSCCCMDLAVRTFDKVHAFYMYLVPGLECIEKQLDAARKRWDVPIRQYPHWCLRVALQHGDYCNPGDWADGLPEWTAEDVYTLARTETGAGVVLHGGKRCDSVWRKRVLSCVNRERRCYPLEKWGKRDVLAYLTARRIPIPGGDERAMGSGVDLSFSSILWLHDEHPRDFARLAEVFPYIEAVVARRTFYGIPKTRRAA